MELDQSRLHNVSCEKIVEIYGWENMDCDSLEKMLSHIQEFADCVTEEHSRISKEWQRLYEASLSWIEIESGTKVTLHYWGDRMNFQLAAEFIKENGEWRKSEIYTY